LNYFQIPAIAPTIDGHNSIHRPATTDIKDVPITAAIKETTEEGMVLQTDVVPLYPDTTSVKRQEQSYIRYKGLMVINIKI